MSNDWLSQLAEEIRLRYHNAALAAAKDAKDKTILDRSAFSVWQSFCEFVASDCNQLGANLGDDPTITQAPLSVTTRPDLTALTVNKAAFPAINFTATFDQNNSQVTMLGTTSAKQAIGMPALQPQPIPFRFEVDQQEAIQIIIDGKRLPGAQAAAEYLIRKLFGLV